MPEIIQNVYILMSNNCKIQVYVRFALEMIISEHRKVTQYRTVP